MPLHQLCMSCSSSSFASLWHLSSISTANTSTAIPRPPSESNQSDPYGFHWFWSISFTGVLFSLKYAEVRLWVLVGFVNRSKHTRLFNIFHSLTKYWLHIAVLGDRNVQTCTWMVLYGVKFINCIGGGVVQHIVQVRTAQENKVDVLWEEHVLNQRPKGWTWWAS